MLSLLNFAFAAGLIAAAMRLFDLVFKDEKGGARW